MTKILDRYASAVNSGNLASDPDTVFSDADVLGAAGLAAKRSPLAISLARLFSGDNRAAPELVRIMAQMLVGKAYRLGAEIEHVKAQDMARAILAWHRDGRCKACHGHGFDLTPADHGGRRTVTERACHVCRGTGKMPFEAQFTRERRELAKWLLAELEREQGIAGSEAMKALAPRLEF